MNHKPLAPWLQKDFQRLLHQPSHALLLQGPSGMGQLALGLALVSAWLCEQPQADGLACLQCSSCHALAVRAHADALVLMPEEEMLRQAWPLPEKAQRELDEKKRKPSKEIRVEAMRAAVEFCQRTSARGRGKAVLIYPAEAMNHITANTLLKTLEEPPGAVRFILVSEAAHLLLPTIRSRCLSHSMQWPSPEQALGWLQAQGVAADAAQASLRAAGNSPEQALAIAQSPENLALCRNLPQVLRQNDVKALQPLPAAEQLAWLQKLCHDLMCLSQGAAPRFFAITDLPQQPPALRLLGRWAKSLSQQARSIEHPYNQGLMTEALVAQARGVLNSAT